MKKFIVLTLTFICVFSLVLASCNQNKTTSPEDDDVPVGLGTLNSNSGTGTGTETSAQNLEWIEKSENVYVYNCQSLAVRSAMDFDDDKNIVTYFKFGYKAERIRYNDLWSVIKYNGQEHYVGTSRLTTDTGSVLFNSKSEIVTLKKAWNLRDFTDATGKYNNIRVFAGTDNKAGDTYKLTGISFNGMWARFEIPDGKDDDGNDKVRVVYGYNYSEYIDIKVETTTTTTATTTTSEPQT